MRLRSRSRPGPLRLVPLALLAFLALAVGRPPALHAQEQECCLLLLVPVGARASALGGAITARTGTDAVFQNPAGLAGLHGSAFVIHHSDLAADQQIKIDAFSLLLTPFSGTIGITYQLFDKGDIESRDGTGQNIGVISVRDHLLVGTFSTALAPGVAAGISYKFFQQRTDCTGLCGSEENVASTQAVDVGVRYAPALWPGLELGLSVVNAGFDVQTENEGQADAFPGRIHAGLSYDVLSQVAADSTVALRVAVEVRDRLSGSGSADLAGGIELDVQEAVFLRAGYAPGKGLGTGAAVGLELRFDRFEIGVSRTFVNTSLGDTEPFQISFGLNF